MKARLLLALLATVLTTAACGESITAPKPVSMVASMESSDTVVVPVGDGPLWGSGTRP